MSQCKITAPATGAVCAIDPHDGTAGSDAIDRDLRPTAGGTTQIDDPAARQQQPKAVVQFDQFESRARPVTEPLRLGDIGSFS
jgi:hypothetical protein